MQKQRISLNDSAVTVVAKMSDGNPGAMNAMLEILQKGDKIDPDGFMGGLGFILLLDSFGIYGSDIYVLHSDICQKDVVKTCAVLRATQLGFFSQDTLQNACHRQDYSGRKMIPVEELYSKVKEKLPRFDAKELTVS
jgi:hypothetical protein